MTKKTVANQPLQVVSASAPNKKLPIYIQIKELLLREIGAGRWVKGERLPTEAELAKQLNVAVGTLRKALHSLEAADVLERRQGSGTYVAQAKKGEAIYHFFRLEKKPDPQDNPDNHHSGVPTAELISVDKVQLSSTAAEAVVLQQLTLQETDSVWRFRRIRYLDQQAVAVEEIFLPQSRAENIDSEAVSESLYLFYRQQLGFWVANVSDKVTVGHYPKWGMDALQMPPKGAATSTSTTTCCGLVERTSYDQHGTACEFSWTWYDPDKALYHARWN